jgi:hypothetical protein
VGRLHLFGDCPDEASQLAGDRGGSDGRWLACPRQLATPPARPFLRLPRGVADRFGKTFLCGRYDPRDISNGIDAYVVSVTIHESGCRFHVKQLYASQ